MQNSPSAPGPSDAPAPPEAESGSPGKARMPAAIVVALVVVALRALTLLVGGWFILEENYSQQEHNQELLMPMSAAWLFAVLCGGLAAAQVYCVVRARGRRAWIRVVLIVFLSLMAFSSVVGIVVSVAAGAASPGTLAFLGADVGALSIVGGAHGRRWFSASGPS